MPRNVVLRSGAVAVALALALAWWLIPRSTPQQIAIDADDIGGVVTGPNGPEGGVWVIAETDDFETRFAKIVVTDALGRYVIPDLPDASYRVWVRGYGLVDSPERPARPGTQLALTAVPAPSAAEAAKYYPAAYWYSMLDVYGHSEGLAPVERDRMVGAFAFKNIGCIGCHQIGNLATRTIPPALGSFPSHEEAWMRRVRSGQAGLGMANQLGQLDGRLVRTFADWTRRIEAGELPRTQPQRPFDIERNLVVTVRDWATEKAYLHDLIATDRRNPTVNAYGPLYGAPELSTDFFPILDPKRNVATSFEAVARAGTPSTVETPPAAPSPYWGDEAIWDSNASIHNPWMDAEGRVWLTARVRAAQNPAWCRAGSTHPSARAFPLDNAGRHLALFDPRTREYTQIETCYGTHHLQLDANDVLWTSGGGQVLGWLDTRKFLATKDAAGSQGWTPLIVDTNGNGRRDAYTEPGEPRDPARDTRVNTAFYAVMPNPADGTIWGAQLGFPGAVMRVAPGPNPSETALTEVFTPPLPGWGIRGADIDRNGVVWAAMGSGHLGSFDRRKCTGPLNGPGATGAHCPEGWEFHQLPGPGFAGFPDNSVESSYYAWVDRFNTSGLGENVPIATGNLADGFHALANGRMVTLRVPYPMGYYAKGLDGRIDDPSAGWKGRGLWGTSGDRTPFHYEGGKGTRPLVVHIQVRPDPLAH